MLVTEGDRVVGVASALDIARAVVDHTLAERTYVFNDDGEFSERY